ncbi:MAG: thioredoxin family protein [Comamonadaceae bacterium]
MSFKNPASPARVLVVCLCAEWCGVCRDYRSRFLQAQSNFPLVQFLWIDVEDEADLLDPLDVEDFPTLLLAVGSEPHFFGPLTPQFETLERLIRSQMHNTSAAALLDPSVVALVAKIRTRERDD